MLAHLGTKRLHGSDLGRFFAFFEASNASSTPVSCACTLASRRASNLTSSAVIVERLAWSLKDLMSGITVSAAQWAEGGNALRELFEVLTCQIPPH